MKFENYEIWTPQGAVKGTLEIKDGKIVGLYPDLQSGEDHFKQNKILPGLIDIHYAWLFGLFRSVCGS